MLDNRNDWRKRNINNPSPKDYKQDNNVAWNKKMTDEFDEIQEKKALEERGLNCGNIQRYFDKYHDLDESSVEDDEEGDEEEEEEEEDDDGHDKKKYKGFE